MIELDDALLPISARQALIVPALAAHASFCLSLHVRVAAVALGSGVCKALLAAALLAIATSLAFMLSVALL